MTIKRGLAAVSGWLAVMAAAPAPAQAPAADVCRVAAVAPVLPPSAGIAVSPADENEVVVARLVGGTYQLVRIDLRNRQEQCLTCKRVAGGPAVDRDKAVPSILPGSGGLIVQVQMPPGPGGAQPAEVSWLNDLWMATRDGERWWNLTRHANAGKDRAGALLPLLAPDGRHLAFAEYRPADPAPWRVRIARIESGADGTPGLHHLPPVAITGAAVYEPLAWSLDGRALLFAADTAHKAPGRHDLWVHDLTTGRTTPLGAAAERFGALAPNGRTLVLAGDVEAPNGSGALRTDLFLVRGDRRTPERLTSFNEAGHPHAADGPDGTNVGRMRWSADGRTIWFERRSYDLDCRRVQSHLARLTFAGPCGASPAAAVAAASPAVPVPRPAALAPAAPGPVPAVGPTGDVPPDPSGGRGGRVGINTSASIAVNGVSRSFRIVAPEKLADGAPVAVVFAFHGLADSNRFMSFYTGLDEAAEKHGFLLIYPQARLGAWPLLIQWIAPDLDFFDALLAHLGRLYNIDRNRVYVTGMSNGAYFINLLTSHRASVIAAMAMHSGGVGVLASNDVKYKRKYPVLILHGTQDIIINVREGRHARVFYKERGHEVELVEFPGLNHFWAYSLGVNDRIWEFFQAHPKRG